MRNEFIKWIIECYESDCIGQDEINWALKGDKRAIELLQDYSSDRSDVIQFIKECMIIARDKHPKKFST